MHRIPRWLTAATSMLLTTSALAQSPAQMPPQGSAVAAVKPLDAAALKFDATRVPDSAQVLRVLNHTAEAQMAMLKDRPHYVGRGGGFGGLTANWISATYLIGLAHLTRAQDQIGGRQYLRDVAEHYNFGLLGGWSPRNMLDADNIAIGAVYQELYALSGSPGEIAPLRERLDYNLRYLQMEPAPKKLVWWWCDALFMAPPVFARMASLTGDHSYLAAMDTQWWRLYDRLWSKEHGLFFRDERFITEKTRNGQPMFWGRGNGWVVAGLARTIEVMPTNFPTRQKYLDTFKTMMASIAKLQRKEDGLWTTSLLDPADPAGPESSGSAFYTYAMAWGINHGVLDRATYLPKVQKAWSGLAAIIQPNGLLGYAQRAGDQPERSGPNDQQLYGTGGLLLAGTEVMKLGQPVSALPIPELKREPQTGPVRLPIALRQPPANATPEQAAAIARSQRERQAMIDLGYDPLVDGARGAGGDGNGQAAPQSGRVTRTDGVVMPRLVQPVLTPPEDKSARASVKYAPYRYDDILWENDRTTHRIYGPALEAFEPPSTSGIDVWGKHVVWPFMERQLKTGKQHDYHGEGVDFYNVGTQRGAGGLGVWQDNKLWVSRNWAKHRILKDGPDVADFEVDYAPWPIGVSRQAWETRRFTLPLGTNFTRMVSTISSDKPGPMLIGIGIQKKPTTTPGNGTFTQDRARGRFSWWSPEDPEEGAIGVGLMIDPAQIENVVQDADNYIILVRVTPGKPFVYYMGGTWSKSIDFHDRATWEKYVMGEKADFTVPKR